MNDTLFTLHSMKMSDDEFWKQMEELDEISETLPDFGGFSIKATLATGKQVNVPFVRFRKTLPDQERSN